MAIDPLRSTGGRIIQLRERPATPAARPPASAPTETGQPGTTTAAEQAPPALNVRKIVVLARIQQDYYQQAHVRERIIESLLEFLDEE